MDRTDSGKTVRIMWDALGAKKNPAKLIGAWQRSLQLWEWSFPSRKPRKGRDLAKIKVGGVGRFLERGFIAFLMRVIARLAIM
jgi:hypothetical protein